MSNCPIKTVPKRRRGEPLPRGTTFRVEPDGRLIQCAARGRPLGCRWHTQWEAEEAVTAAHLPFPLVVEPEDSLWIARVQTRAEQKPPEEQRGEGSDPPRPDWKVRCSCGNPACRETFTLHELDFHRWTAQGYLLIAQRCPSPLYRTDKVVAEHADYRVVRRYSPRPRWV
jgi:hypothetical protein